ENQQDLQQRCQFADKRGRKCSRANNQQDDRGHGQNAHVAREDQDGQPPVNHSFERQDDERAREQEFVGHRIEKRPELALLVQPARQQAIEGVRESCGDQQNERPAVALVEQTNQKYRDQNEAQEGDLIRDSPEGRAHNRSGALTESRQIGRERATYLLLEQIRHGPDRAMAFVEGNSLNAQHGKEDGGQAGGLALGVARLADELVERLQADAAQGGAGGRNPDQFPPHLF